MGGGLIVDYMLGAARLNEFQKLIDPLLDTGMLWLPNAVLPLIKHTETFSNRGVEEFRLERRQLIKPFEIDVFADNALLMKVIQIYLAYLTRDKITARFQLLQRQTRYSNNLLTTDDKDIFRRGKFQELLLNPAHIDTSYVTLVTVSKPDLGVNCQVLTDGNWVDIDEKRSGVMILGGSLSDNPIPRRVILRDPILSDGSIRQFHREANIIQIRPNCD